VKQGKLQSETSAAKEHVFLSYQGKPSSLISCVKLLRLDSPHLENKNSVEHYHYRKWFLDVPNLQRTAIALSTHIVLTVNINPTTE
jgi:hypothetical protein